MLGQAKVDPGDRALVALRVRTTSGHAGASSLAPALLERGVDRRQRHDELGLAAAQSQLDRARRELDRDLLRRGRQRVLQREADRRVERCDEALGERSGVLAAGLGGGLELAVDVLDVRSEVHGTMMASLWCHVNPALVS